MNENVANKFDPFAILDEARLQRQINSIPGGVGSSLAITDGTTTVEDVAQITVIGGVIGGVSPDGTLTITGNGISLPLPFFGTSNPPWVRPSLNIGGPSSAFNTWLNQGGQVYAYGATGAINHSFSNNGTGPAVAPGTVYAPGDTITITGGTGTAAVGTITDTQLVSATIVSAGSGAHGVIATSAVNNGGTLYAPGDTGTITTGSGNATYQVSTVGVSGDVTAFTLTASGTAYSVSTNNATSVSSGSGDGTFTIDINSIIPFSAQVIGTTGAGPQLFILDVTIGSSGTITGINDINNAGDYTTNPTVLATEPVADNSSSGITGATVSVVMGALAAIPQTSGAYSVNPSNPASQSASSGSGTGATWNLQISDIATAVDGAGGTPLVVQAGGVLTRSHAPDTQNNNATAYQTALLKPLGGTPWTVTVGVAAVSFAAGYNTSDGPGTYVQQTPLVLYDSVSDKALAFGWMSNSGGQGVGLLTVDRLTSASVPGLTSATLQNTGPTANHLYWSVAPTYFLWFRVTNDGTNLKLYGSFENIAYFLIHQEPLSSFGATYDFVGFGMERTGVLNNTFDGSPLSAIPLWNFTQTSP